MLIRCHIGKILKGKKKYVSLDVQNYIIVHVNLIALQIYTSTGLLCNVKRYQSLFCTNK